MTGQQIIRISLQSGISRKHQELLINRVMGIRGVAEISIPKETPPYGLSGSDLRAHFQDAGERPVPLSWRITVEGTARVPELVEKLLGLPGVHSAGSLQVFRPYMPPILRNTP